MQIQESISMSKAGCLVESFWIHLVQSIHTIAFSAINTYNCFWFKVANIRNFNDWRLKHGEKWPMLTTFFLTATVALIGNNDDDDYDYDYDEADDAVGCD